MFVDLNFQNTNTYAYSIPTKIRWVHIQLIMIRNMHVRLTRVLSAPRVHT